MLNKKNVQWVIARASDDSGNGDLGVKIGDQIFTMYKGGSLPLNNGFWRPLGARELGESIEASEESKNFDWVKFSGEPLYQDGLSPCDKIIKISDEIHHIHFVENGKIAIIEVCKESSSFKMMAMGPLAADFNALSNVMFRINIFVKANNLTEKIYML